jgi:hypothetical protein
MSRLILPQAPLAFRGRYPCRCPHFAGRHAALARP